KIGRLVHHMTVGQDISVWREDHPRPSSDDAAGRARPAGAGGDAHDRRADVLHDRDDRLRVGIQELAIVDTAGLESVRHCSPLWRFFRCPALAARFTLLWALVSACRYV